MTYGITEGAQENYYYMFLIDSSFPGPASVQTYSLVYRGGLIETTMHLQRLEILNERCLLYLLSNARDNTRAMIFRGAKVRCNVTSFFSFLQIHFIIEGMNSGTKKEVS